MVAVTSRQVSPFQALMNMIKINYVDKSEVFRTLIAVLCDYDSNSSQSISRTLRYIRVLLTANVDLAECLISFLPQPVSKTNVSIRNEGHPTDRVQLHDEPEICSHSSSVLNHHIQQSLNDIHTAPMSKQCVCSWFRPTVKESCQTTGFTITASVSDVKRVTSAEFDYDDTSPHPRPLMIPNLGGIANHTHVIPPSDSETLYTRPSAVADAYAATIPMLFPSSKYSFENHGPFLVPAQKTALDLSAKELKDADLGDKSHDHKIPAHQLLQSAMHGVSNISFSSNLFGYKNLGIDPHNPVAHGYFQPHPTVAVAEHGITPVCDMYQAPVSGIIPFYKPDPQATRKPPNMGETASHVLGDAIATPQRIPVGLSIPLSTLLTQGVKPLTAVNPTLTHLLGMTKSTTTTTASEPQKHSNAADDQLSDPPKKVPRQIYANPGREHESLKALTLKLKIAEKKLQLSQLYAREIVEPPVQISMSSSSAQLNRNKPDQGATRNLTSFPYIQRIILPDGDVRTLNIDGTAGKVEVISGEHQHQSIGNSDVDPQADKHRKKKQETRKYKFKKVVKQLNKS